MDERALDRYLTREPDYFRDGEPAALKCSGCGKFLREQEDGIREWVNVERCSGEPSVIECTYGDAASDEQILAIIGEEHRGKTYRVAFSAACGSMKGSGHATYDGEVSPDKVEEWKHDSHFFVPEWGYQQVAVRVCKCGHVNEEALS